MGNIKKIVILYGGSSSEREVSIKSGEGIYKACKDLGYYADLLDLNDLNLNKPDLLYEFDIVFIALHGFEGESGKLQKKLDEMGILYTGSNQHACEKTWNKAKFKNILNLESISTPRGFSVDRLCKDMDSPFEMFQEKYNQKVEQLFLKPAEDGSSVDTFQINSSDDVEQSFKKALDPNRAFIFEESIKYKEFTVSILDNKCLPVLEVKYENDFYDYDAKYISNETQLNEANLEDSLKKEIELLSLEAFNAVGCTGWGRVDLLQDSKEKFYILEINTVPGMTSHSCVPKSAALAGMPYKDLIKSIIENAAK